MPTVTRPHPIKRRMFELDVTQERLSAHLRIDSSLVGRYLRGVRPMPEGFAARCHEALDLFEEAERAAEEARARVLGGEG